jgi:hypothetical protein
MSPPERLILLACAVYIVFDGLLKGLGVLAKWADARGW